MKSRSLIITEEEAARERLDPVHPGEVLREDYLVPLSMTAYQLAKGLAMSPTAVGQILSGKRSVTPVTALRLSRFFGTSADFWMNLQTGYDLEVEERQREDDLAKIVPYRKVA